jgi:serine/threonine-protein kinase
LGDRYRIEGLLGSGGTANVYVAVDTRIGHSVVVKQLNRDGVDNEGIRARFLAEGEALANLQHPRIMRVLDFATGRDGLPYIVTEALVGETLASLLSRRPLLPPAMTLMIARQTAQGLIAAHRAGIIHRDIKPHNLFLLGQRGAPFGVKIIDFGMAKVTRADRSSADVTSDPTGIHTVLGTIEYMAPEQAMADPVDGRADIYGFGIVLFRLLTGHLPFPASTEIDLLCHQLYSPVPSPSWFDDTIDPHLDAIVTRATRKHPDNRYRNVRAMLSDLDVAMGLCHGDPADTALVVEPDVYRPRNAKGREVAELLAERHATLALNQIGQSARDAAYALTRPESVMPEALSGLLASQATDETSADESAPESIAFEELADEDLVGEG